MAAFNFILYRVQCIGYLRSTYLIKIEIGIKKRYIRARMREICKLRDLHHCNVIGNELDHVIFWD